MTSTPKCFVIMPITTPVMYLDNYNNDENHFINVFVHLFTPAVERAGFEIVSPKSVGSDLIHADIITNLSYCEHVLCDMSTVNPNVFFEFGIRCALDKPVSLVVDNSTENIPFDTRIINYHTYTSLPIWDKDKQIELLSVHIRESYEKSKGHNALWKYFGIKQTGSYNPGNATIDEKLDFIVNMLSEEKRQVEKRVLDGIRENYDPSLTRKENIILKLLSEDKSEKEIASILNSSEEGIRKTLMIMAVKLDVRDTSVVVDYAKARHAPHASPYVVRHE